LATKTKAAIKLQLTPDVEMSEEEFNKNIEVIKLHVKLGPNQTTRLRWLLEIKIPFIAVADIRLNQNLAAIGGGDC
jgi:hypothetical protein